MSSNDKTNLKKIYNWKLSPIHYLRTATFLVIITNNIQKKNILLWKLINSHLQTFFDRNAFEDSDILPS